MFIGEIMLILELQANKDNPVKLKELFEKHREQLLKMKQKYPQWKSYIEPAVLEELRKMGLPVD
ncbi:hypothetical protein [Desulforamulus ruminis]|uniref:Uncharacterized protein n=1 Tax=Desulforamulus ruminis (strain ATCC 23193 / DSM 2154 / NCIMB 8452 / DL) TaxID=696281 RepID=F6DLK4_DESRL|nr:hypothetical protein [Desulforamulus ruminis]AEG61646.1 hypothetical protein Desru_3443 [Desulforamulus ruminis DSM 2154]